MQFQLDQCCSSGLQDWTGEQRVSSALQAMLPHIPYARWVITTLGSKGSVLLQRQPEGQSADEDGEEATLDDVFKRLTEQSQSGHQSPGAATACTSAKGVSIRCEPAC